MSQTSIKDFFPSLNSSSPSYFSAPHPSQTFNSCRHPPLFFPLYTSALDQGPNSRSHPNTPKLLLEYLIYHFEFALLMQEDPLLPVPTHLSLPRLQISQNNVKSFACKKLASSQQSEINSLSVTTKTWPSS